MKIYNLYGIIAFFPIWAFRANLDYIDIITIFIVFFFIPFFVHLKILKNYSSNFNIFFSTWMSILFVYSVDQNIGLWTFSLRISDLTISNYVKSSIFLLFFFFLSFLMILMLKRNGIKIFLSITLTIFIFNVLDTSRNFSNFPKIETKNTFDNNNINESRKLILIFDEMSGITSEDSNHTSGKEAVNAIFDVFMNNNFKIYTNIFSIFISTKKQIPSTLNFITSEKNYIAKQDQSKDKFLYLKKSKNYFQTFDLKQNSFFDQNYVNKVIVYQSMYLNYCKHKKVYKCHQYNPFNKKNEFLVGFKYNFLTKTISAYKNNASSTSAIIWRMLRHLNVIDSVLEPEGEKATFKYTLENIIKSLEDKGVDLVFAHILVPHEPYAFNDKCEYDGTRGTKYNFMSIDQKRSQHNMERTCVAYYLDYFFNTLKKKKIFNDLDITIFSDHDSRISKDKLGSSVIFARKEAYSNNSEKITEKTSSNFIFSKIYNKSN